MSATTTTSRQGSDRIKHEAEGRERQTSRESARHGGSGRDIRGDAGVGDEADDELGPGAASDLRAHEERLGMGIKNHEALDSSFKNETAWS